MIAKGDIQLFYTKYTIFSSNCGTRMELLQFPIKFMFANSKAGARGGLGVNALRYKPAGRGFDSRWCHWNFSVT